MFEYLKDYKQIFVTGMQRSGTTICMRMIQYDIEASYCIWTGGEVRKILMMEKCPVEFSYPIVFHCPGLSYLIHKIEDESEFAVVWMKRDREEIIDSVIKRDWDPRVDLETYKISPTEDLRENINALITVKENRWKEQKKEIKNWYEVEYESLKPHRLWIDKKDRNWGNHSRHTSIGMSKLIKKKCLAWEGGELEHLLKEFPK